MDLKDKTILVTGGGSGLGRELVLELLFEKCKVIAVDINDAGLKETYRLAGNDRNLACYRADISDIETVEGMAKDILSGGNVDGLINNAGVIQPFVRTEKLPINAAKRIFDVNFWGTLSVIHSFLPHLRTRPVAQVVNISSMGGFLPIPGQAVYGASKAAVKMLSESLAIELRNSNVHVVTVFPGAMRTDIKKNSGIDDGKTAEECQDVLAPNDAAYQIISAMKENKKSLYVGDDSKSMSLLCQINPDRAVERITSMIHHDF